MPPTIDDVLERARKRLKRVEPHQAAAELAQGALLVDTRTEKQRAKQGEIPGAVVIVRSPTLGDWSEAFGTRQVGMTKPLGVDDHFRIGSTTKTMTGTVIAR